ncbi:hypothetical protein C8R44DRAFT_823592 [Mycena epipterygia]|nr:hypothetical protein C8R44DRAFT_823592 [Mycena epipterygia]
MVSSSVAGPNLTTVGFKTAAARPYILPSIPVRPISVVSPGQPRPGPVLCAGVIQDTRQESG